MAVRSTFKDYYYLTKPGIIYGNLLSATAGFLYGAAGNVDADLMFFTLSGMALLMASACVFNNYIDRDIDKLMARTKQRAIVRGAISARSALTFGTVLGILSVVLLSFTNTLTVVLGLIAFFDYVVLYGISKRKSVYGTAVGSIAGSLPIVAGYTAATDSLDSQALWLFAILVCWQMAHFYAISMFRSKEYENAHLPVLAVKEGPNVTRYNIVAYILGLLILIGLAAKLSYTSLTTAAVMAIATIWWLGVGLLNLKVESVKWGRKMFVTSLIFLLIYCLMLSLNSFLP